jgi:hypothetical protein
LHVTVAIPGPGTESGKQSGRQECNDRRLHYISSLK